jgi:hypothetical protein
MRADRFLATDAQVFLQGATSEMTRDQFQEYLDLLKRGHRGIRAISRVFVTDHGAGWLITINYVEALENPAPPTAGLWMEAQSQGDQITKLWIHFPVEAIARTMDTAEIYQAAALSRGMPVPPGWRDGTPALLAAAESTDQQITGGMHVWSMPLLAATLTLLLLAAGGLLVAARRRRLLLYVARPASSHLLARLREAHPAGVHNTLS